MRHMIGFAFLLCAALALGAPTVPPKNAPPAPTAPPTRAAPRAPLGVRGETRIEPNGSILLLRRKPGGGAAGGFFMSPAGKWNTSAIPPAPANVVAALKTVSAYLDQVVATSP